MGCPFTGPTDQTVANAGLASALANNGGPTQTHALLPGSPAIDKGNSFGATTDQRLIMRPFDFAGLAPATGGDNTDIGAYELQAVCPVEAANTPGTSCTLPANPGSPAAGPTGQRAAALKKCKKKKRKARKKCRKKAKKLPV